MAISAGTDGVGEVDYHQLDVASDESVAKFKGFVETKYGRVDVLVNNGGTAYAWRKGKPQRVEARLTDPTQAT